jgi:hypothetical protein
VGSSGYLFHKFVDRDVMKMLIRFQRDPGGTEGGVVLATLHSSSYPVRWFKSKLRGISKDS